MNGINDDDQETLADYPSMRQRFSHDVNFRQEAMELFRTCQSLDAEIESTDDEATREHLRQEHANKISSLRQQVGWVGQPPENTEPLMMPRSPPTRGRKAIMTWSSDDADGSDTSASTHCLEPGLSQKRHTRMSAGASRHLFYWCCALLAPLLISLFAFVATVTPAESDVTVPLACAIHIGAALLIFVLPAACMPDEPPAEWSRGIDLFWICITAVAWHSISVKWEQTESEGRNSRTVRRSLVVGLAAVITLSAGLQCYLGPGQWWAITRVASGMCGLLRLSAVLLLYLDGATSYPPGALPLPHVLPVVSVMPLCSWLMTPGFRQRLARSAGLAQRIQSLQRRTKRWCMPF